MTEQVADRRTSNRCHGGYERTRVRPEPPAALVGKVVATMDGQLVAIRLLAREVLALRVVPDLADEPVGHEQHKAVLLDSGHDGIVVAMGVRDPCDGPDGMFGLF